MLPQVAKRIGVTEQTYYRWRKEYVGLRRDQAKRFKELEQANAELDKAILRETAAGNFWARPAAELTAARARNLLDQVDTSIRRAATIGQGPRSAPARSTRRFRRRGAARPQVAAPYSAISRRSKFEHRFRTV